MKDISGYIDRLPNFDLEWTEKIKDGWFRCFNTIFEMIVNAQR